jgi:radical SAM superfamily enzyme YgiQ (UPF0313 family)
MIKMRVLLLNPTYLRGKGFMRNARWTALSMAGSEWFPIWLAYATGLLEKHKHTANLLDANTESRTREETIKIAKEFNPELLAVYVSTDSLASDIEISEAISEATGCEIVLVGPWACIDSKEIAKKSEKIMIAIGEFDYTLLDLANKLEKEKIEGLIWRKDNKIVVNKPRPRLTKEQLDEFPFVTKIYKNHIDIRKYHQAAHLHPFIDLFTGRGCFWGQCTFCLWPFTITKGKPNYVIRDMKDVIDEVRFVKRELPFVREIFIQDDTFPGWRAKEFSKALIENGIKLTWSCYARADLDYDTLEIMKNSGCRLMHVGYESGDLEILKNINKGVTIEQMEQFTKDANKLGIMIHADFIIGLPGETVESIKRTVEWARKLKVHSYQFTTPKPYKGTLFYTWLDKKKYLKDGDVNYPNLSFEDLKKWTNWALKKTNLNPAYLARMMVKPKEWRRLIRSAYYMLPRVYK